MLKELNLLSSNSLFRKLFAAQIVSYFSSSASTMALIFAMFDSSSGVAGAGIVLGARALPNVIFGLIGGIVADRLPKRLVGIASSLSTSLLQGALAFILIMSLHEALWPVVMCTFLIGSVQALSASSLYSLIPEIVPGELIQSAQAITRMTRNIAFIAGPIFGGLLIVSVSTSLIFIINAIGSLITGLLLSKLPMVPKNKPSSSLIKDFHQGWVEIIARPWLSISILAFSLALPAWSGGYIILGASQILAHGGSAATWGALEAALGMGFIVGGVIALKWKPKNLVSFSLVCQSLTGFSLVALALQTHFPFLLATSFMAGVAMDMAGIVWATAMQRLIPIDVLGRVSSFDYVGSFGLIPFGYMLAQPLSDFLDNSSAALLVLAALIFMPTLIAASLPFIRKMTLPVH